MNSARQGDQDQRPVNIRRYPRHFEHAIAGAIAWVVVEPNGEARGRERATRSAIS